MGKRARLEGGNVKKTAQVLAGLAAMLAASAAGAADGAHPRKVWGLGAAGVDVPLKILQGVDMRELKVRSIDRFQYFREKPVY
jgi:phage-related tail protein